MKSRTWLAVVLPSLIYVSAPEQVLSQTPWAIGDVIVSSGEGTYGVYTPSGQLKEIINDGLGGITTGCSFSPGLDRLYTTDFTQNTVVAYADEDPHGIVMTTSSSPLGAVANESVVVDAAGNFFVGHSGAQSGNADVFKYDPNGNLLGQFNVATEWAGSDWVDLAADQRTLFYTSEGRTIFRYDTVDSAQLLEFAVISHPGEAHGLRLLPPGDGSGGLLVADTSDIKRLDGAGNVVQIYDAPDVVEWHTLSLDATGSSFWAGDPYTNDFYRFNMATGAVEMGPIRAAGSIFGICVKGELRAGACAEAGLATLQETPAEGVISGAVHEAVEPLADEIDPSVGSAVHQVNCATVVPIEGIVNGSIS